jgi:hypothetical protein
MRCERAEDIPKGKIAFAGSFFSSHRGLQMTTNDRLLARPSVTRRDVVGVASLSIAATASAAPVLAQETRPWLGKEFLFDRV